MPVPHFREVHELKNDGRKPEWLLNLCKGKSPGIILIDGDIDKTPCLDFAYEIGATMMELGVAQRLCVWSWRAFLWLYGRLLVGDSAGDAHCWTITKDVGIMPPLLQPLAGTLIEDDMDMDSRMSLHEMINAPESASGKSCVGGGDLTIVEFKEQISLEFLEPLNKAAKESGKTFVVVSELVDSQGKSYDATSYGELSLRISVEHGIDLTECAESVVSLRGQDDGRWRNVMPDRVLCRPLRIWNDDKCGDLPILVGRYEQGRFIFEKEENNGETK
jgi:hypothetical protein